MIIIYSLNMRLLKLVLLIAVVACYNVQAQSDTEEMENQEKRYDIGCYEKHDELAKKENVLELIRQGARVPFCVEGGMFRTVQCSIGDCYCAYVDTGNEIGSMDLNNYTYQELIDSCPVQFENEIVDNCTLPPLNYPCELTNEKFFFNSEMQICEASSLGCFGFKSREECASQCVVEQIYTNCTYPLDVGETCLEAGEQERFRHDPTTGQCVPFNYKGCGGNTNNYNTKWECEMSCVSREIEVIALVESTYLFEINIQRWIASKYNLDTSSMNMMATSIFIKIYKLASSTKYLERIGTASPPPTATTTIEGKTTQSIAEETTQSIPEEQLIRLNGNVTEICRQPPEQGNCRGFFSRWHYDHEASYCKRFLYGGCLPNGNNFVSYEECGKYCGAKRKPPAQELEKPQFIFRGK